MENVLCQIACRLHAMHVAGDHTIVVGKCFPPRSFRVSRCCLRGDYTRLLSDRERCPFFSLATPHFLLNDARKGIGLYAVFRAHSCHFRCESPQLAGRTCGHAISRISRPSLLAISSPNPDRPVDELHMFEAKLLGTARRIPPALRHYIGRRVCIANVNFPTVIRSLSTHLQRFELVHLRR